MTVTFISEIVQVPSGVHAPPMDTHTHTYTHFSPFMPIPSNHLSPEATNPDSVHLTIAETLTQGLTTHQADTNSIHNNNIKGNQPALCPQPQLLGVTFGS